MQTKFVLGGITAVLILLGCLFRVGKATLFIPGYNSATEEEQQRYDLRALTHFASRFMFMIAFGVALVLAGVMWDSVVCVAAGGSIISGTIIGSLIYCGKGNRFKNQ